MTRQTDNSQTLLGLCVLRDLSLSSEKWGALEVLETLFLNLLANDNMHCQTWHHHLSLSSPHVTSQQHKIQLSSSLSLFFVGFQSTIISWFPWTLLACPQQLPCCVLFLCRISKSSHIKAPSSAHFSLSGGVPSCWCLVNIYLPSELQFRSLESHLLFNRMWKSPPLPFLNCPNSQSYPNV